MRVRGPVIEGRGMEWKSRGSFKSQAVQKFRRRLICSSGRLVPLLRCPSQDLPALGRFTLRDEGRTIAIGKVIKLPKSQG